MRCEYCGKTLRQGDLVHGFKFGTLTATGFKADLDSAISVICGACGEMVYRTVYSYLDADKLPYPAIFRVYEELTAIMKNGYRVIQAISKLPAIDQSAIQRLITIFKEVR